MFGTLSLSSGFRRAWIAPPLRFFSHDTHSLSGRLRPAPLYTCHYPWQSSHGPSNSACWDLHCNLDFTNGLLPSLQRFWPCYLVSILSFSPWTPSVLMPHLQLMLRHQQWSLPVCVLGDFNAAIAVPHDPFLISKPVPFERFLHITKFSCQLERQPWPRENPVI